MLRRSLFSLSLAFLGSSAWAADKPVSAIPLKQRLYNLIHQSSQLQKSKVGVYVEVVKTGRIVFSDRGGEPMIPASNLKIVTTAAALDLLGPDYRFETELRGNSPNGQGVMEGNLYLRGSGDPTWCHPYNEPDSAFRFFSKQLHKSGVRVIAGDVVGDDSVFDREGTGKGWFERYMLDGYAAPVAGLSMNNNVVELSITAQGVRLFPDSPGFAIKNLVKAAGFTELAVLRAPGSDITTVKGAVAGGAIVKRQITVPNPALFTTGAFAQNLKKSGIEVRGAVRLVDTYEPAQVRTTKLLARYQSPRLQEILSQINRESDNVFAQHVFKAAGHKSRGYGTATNGELAVIDFFRKNGLNSEGLVMVDGCGLSTLDRISPRQLVGVLGAMWRHPKGQAFIDSLPTGGEGTLQVRLSGIVVRAKTGTINDHSALSGLVVTAHGQTLAFSVLVNDVPAVWSAIDLEDKIVRHLAACTETL